MNLLPLLVALYEERSVTLAARRLDMSQPVVSKALARLRQTLGDQLFVRTANGMEPTPRTIAVIETARDVLSRVNLDILQPTAFDPTTADTGFTLALSELAELFSLPRLFKRLREVAPRAAIIPVYPPMDELEDGLESGKIDIAIGIYPELGKSNFFRQRLLVSGVACILRSDHPIQGNRLTMDQYLKLNHVVVRGGHRPLVVERLFHCQKLPRKVELVTSHYLSLPEIIQHTDLIATILRPLAEYFCRAHKNLKLMEPPMEERLVEIHQVWHRRFNDDPKNKWLRALIKENYP